MNPTAQQIIQFLEDEGISVKTRNLDKPTWKITFNEPWGTNDSKYRCGIFRILDRETQKYIVRFNSFKAVATLNEKAYRGSIWQFIKLLKEFNTIKEAKIWFIKNYMFNHNLKELLSEDKNVFVNDENGEVDLQKPSLDFPAHFMRVCNCGSCKQSRSNQCSYPWVCQYLLGRGMVYDQFDRFKLFADLKQKRIIFPVYEDGKLIFYTGRSINDKNKIPWLKSEGADLLPMWNLENVNGETINIFEAILDAILVPNGIATLGSLMIFNEKAIEKIVYKNFHQINLIFDNDIAGRKAKIATAKTLTEKYHHKNVWVYNFKGIKEKDFNLMKQHKVNFDLKSRLVKWNLKTETAFNLGVYK